MARVVCVLLQRKDLSIPWGFRLTGGKELSRPLIIHKVAAGTIASQQLKPGDVVLALQDKSARSLTLHDALQLIRTATLSLEITVHQSPSTLQTLIPAAVMQRASKTTDISNSIEYNKYGNAKYPEKSIKTEVDIGTKNFNRDNKETSPESSFLDSASRSSRERLPDIVPKDVLMCTLNNEVDVTSQYSEKSTQNYSKVYSNSCGRQSSQISGAQGNGMSGAPGNGGPPMPPPMPPSMMAGQGGGPPPPPPLPPPGLPSAKLNAQILERGSRLGPPAAIQAAMGKDKKPFTYTPGGIDLSEIRSPRMQRRICRNAAAEGVSVPPPPQTLPTPQAGGIPRPPPMHPQLAVAVLPPPPSNKNDTPPTPSSIKNMSPMKNNGNDGNKPPINVTNNMNNISNNNEARKPPSNVYIPQQQPAINNAGGVNYGNGNNKPMQVQQTGHIYVAPVNPKVETQGITSQLGSLYIPAVPSTPPTPQTPQSQSPASPLQVNLNQAAKPWLNSQNRQQPMSPQNVAPHVVQHVAARQQPQSPPTGVWSPPNTPSTRMIPIQVEGRESPVNAGPQQNTGARTRVVPIQVEGSGAPSPPPQQQWQQQQQPRVQPIYTHNKFGPGQEQSNVPTSPSPPVQSRSFRVLQRITASDEDGQGGPQAAPVSHTGPPPPPPAQQFYQQQQQQQQQPKLQLSNDDRRLMDHFKAQDTVAQQEQDDAGLQLYRGANIPSRVFRLLDKSVDGEIFLHSEADPRYRGAAIPSRAFRMLQTMTEGSPMVPQAAVPGMQGGGNMQNMQQIQQQQQQQHQQQQQQQQHQQGRPEWSSPPPVMMQVRPDTMSPQQAYVPASEQGAQPEPRKYTGSCIPSRSFRMLQAMTAPEDCESTENSDVTSEAMYYAPHSPCPPSPYSWYYPTEGGSGDPVWDSYIYAYMSNYGHCPPGYYYPQHCNNYESDDYSGYSSTEEMAYYGQQRVPPPQNQPSPLAQSEVEESAESAVEEEQQDCGSASTSDDEAGEDGDEDDEDSDTEVEESDDEQKSNRLSGSGLQAIKSVHDIHATSGHEEEQEEDDSECGSDVEDSEGAGRLGAKQLSVIYEESEHSDAESVRRMRWRASQTPALTETEEESSDADEPSQETKLDVSKKPLQNSNDKIYCDNNTRDKNLSDDEVSKVNVSNNFDKNSDESEESEEESEDNEENIECKKEVIKVEDEEEEVSDEEECEEDKNSAGSDAVSDESEEESDDRDSSDKNEKPLKSVSADEDESCVSNETNTSTNEESSDDENERKSNKLKNSPTVVEIKKSTTENNESDSNSEGEEPEATVTVRLPLRLKFSRNSSEEAVTTLIVGDSEQVSRGKNATEPSAAAAKVEQWMQRGESETSCNTNEDPQVSVCLSLPLRRKPAPPVETTEAEDSHWEDDSSSTSIQTVRPRCASLADAMSVLPQSQESAITTEERLQSPSINEEESEQQTLETTNISEPPVTVKKSKSKDKTSQAAEKRAKRTIRRSSTEDDSGVTDLSRQMSDSESEVGAELLACQRAATHSRLFKLLQDACDGEEDDDEESQPRRELLHLPLRSDLRAEHDSSSLSSSGITSPASPTVAARLVRELAKELTRRKGKRQRPARLHAAAMRIMKEEDNDPYDTTTGSSASSDSGGARPSPLQPPNAAHAAVAAAPPMPAAYYPPYPPPPPPHVLAAYGPNYYEYLDYYNSWAAMDPRDYAVVPARAFRVLSNPGASPLDAPYAKCPRIICPNNSAPVPNKSQSPCHAQTPAS